MFRGKKYAPAEFAVFALLILLSLFLRIASLDYIDADDNYEEAAYKNLYQNGTSCYKYSLITTKITLFLIEQLGFSMPVLRLPSILYSMLTVIFIYILVRRFGRIPALISILLFAISPWSIALSRVTRDYAFDCMMTAIILYLLIAIMNRKENKRTQDYIFDLFAYTSIIIIVYLLTILNGRAQTKIVILFPMVAIAMAVYELSRQNIKNKKLLIFLWSSLVVIGGILIYFSEHRNFASGFTFHEIFFHMFFTPTVKSPWQWFHNVKLPGFAILYFLLFLFPLYIGLKKEKKYTENYIFLYLSFFFVLGLFIFKFQSHIHYYPTRYVYFLFPIYIIFYSLTTYYLITFFTKKKVPRIIITVVVAAVFLKLLNINNLVYAVHPRKAYLEKGVNTIFVDNLGVGRFRLEEVITFLKNDLSWNKNQIYVFGSRYAEFLLLMDYKMDSQRCLKIRPGLFYDVGENMYVEADYWGQHELEYAIKKHKEGYFVTSDIYLTDTENGDNYVLPDKDFTIYGETLKYINKIDNYRFYFWNKEENS